MSEREPIRFILVVENENGERIHVETTRCQSPRSARSKARKVARSMMPWGFHGWGHYWRVLDVDTKEQLWAGRLMRGMKR